MDVRKVLSISSLEDRVAEIIKASHTTMFACEGQEKQGKANDQSSRHDKAQMR